jgi:aminopeptidase N
MSQFEDVSARRALPCFDEPGWKTPWRITIDAPSAHFVAANSPEARATPLADRPGWTRHEFSVTRPLPAYLVALAVGPYEVVDGGVAGANRTPLRYIVPKGRAAEARYAKEVTPRLLEILEAYFGVPYPFEKLDSLARPDSVRSFAMENAGLITYGTDSMLATEREETPRFRRGYAGVAAHEIAHMWFGDLVTMAWWDDAWLNEGFATWIGQKTMYRLRPEWDDGAWRARERARAISTDRLASARRVRNPVEAKDRIADAFDSISYEKGGAVLEMFERWMGEERFRQGVRDYLARHAWARPPRTISSAPSAPLRGAGKRSRRWKASSTRRGCRSSGSSSFAARAARRCTSRSSACGRSGREPRTASG